MSQNWLNYKKLNSSILHQDFKCTNNQDVTLYRLEPSLMLVAGGCNISNSCWKLFFYPPYVFDLKYNPQLLSVSSVRNYSARFHNVSHRILQA